MSKAIPGPFDESTADPNPSESDWILVTQWGSLYDPNGYTTGDTGHSAGTITWEADSSYDSVVDGFREAAPGREVQLITLWSDLDLLTDRIEVKSEFSLFPGISGTTLYSSSTCIVDDALANIGSTNGMGFDLAVLSTSAHQSRSVSTTSSGAGGTNNMGIMDKYVSVFDWVKASSSRPIRGLSKARDSGTLNWESATETEGGSGSTTASDWYIQDRFFHRSTTVSANYKIIKQVFVRRTVTSGPE